MEKNNRKKKWVVGVVTTAFCIAAVIGMLTLIGGKKAVKVSAYPVTAFNEYGYFSQEQL